MPSAGFLAASCVLAALLAGCSSKSGPDASEESADPTCRGRVSSWGPESSFVVDDGLKLEVVALVPSTPIVGDNAWQLRLVGDGQPVEGAELHVVPFMPDHAHASTKAVGVSELSPGTYSLKPVYFQMPGYWQVQTDITTGTAQRGSVDLEVCITQD